MALDTTLVSALHRDGSARRGAAHNEGVAISVAERRKEQRYPELVGRRVRARLVVLPWRLEAGGLPPHSVSSGSLAHARAREEGWILHRPS